MTALLRSLYASPDVHRPQTKDFAEWHGALADQQVRDAITTRLVRVEAGLLGDTKSVGGKVSELRVDVGPGYRLYYTRRGLAVILLLCGGDKGSQKRDIERAQDMVEELGKAEKAAKPKGRKKSKL